MLVPNPEVIRGPGCIVRLPELARGRVFLVSDAGLAAAGHVDRAEALLRRAGAEVEVWADAREDPTPADVDRCVAAASARPRDVLVALGGGSVIDTAKATNLLLANPGSITDHAGLGEAGSALRLVVVPTTAGTGSECQSAALVSDPVTHAKTACLAPGLSADAALLDPLLTLTQPRPVTVACGLDALVHAVETAVTRTRTAESVVLSRRAFGLAWLALPKVVADPDDLAARTDMLEAAHLGGAAIARSMLGAAHATGNALTAAHGLTHGVAVASMLPAVVRFNAGDPTIRAAYLELAAGAGLATLDELVEGLRARVALAEPELPVGADVGALVALATPQLTARFNPRPLDAEAFSGLFTETLAS